MIAQGYWIWQLWNVKPEGYERIDGSKGLNGGPDNANKLAAADQAVSVAVKYAPVYALGNLCIGVSCGSSLCVASPDKYFCSWMASLLAQRKLQRVAGSCDGQHRYSARRSRRAATLDTK